MQFDFLNGLLFDVNNPANQVGTFTLTSQIENEAPITLTNSSLIQAFQIPGTTNIAIQGNGTDFNQNPTIGLMVTLTNPAFSILSFNVASTETVNGNPPQNLGFNIGNGTGGNAADLGLSFNVPGTFTTPNTTTGVFNFDAVNSDIQADGPLAAADTLTSGNHADDTFLFVSSSPIGDGDLFETTITSFDDNSIAWEAFRFDINIVPEPSSSALLGLGVLGFLVRRKRK